MARPCCQSAPSPPSPTPGRGNLNPPHSVAPQCEAHTRTPTPNPATARSLPGARMHAEGLACPLIPHARPPAASHPQAPPQMARPP
jgi:hypothetical protein